MGNNAVTESESKQAIARIEARSETPTYRSLRHELGDRGSFTTLGNALRAHRREKHRSLLEEAGSADQVPVGDRILQGMVAGAERTWAELLEAAQDQIDEAERAAAERVAKALEERAEAQQEASAAREREQSTTAALAVAQDNERHLADRLETMKQNMTAETHARRLAEERRAGTEELLAARTSEYERERAARQHSDTRCERAEQALSAERARARTQEDTSRETITALQVDLASERTHTRALNAALQRLEQELKLARRMRRRPSLSRSNRAMEATPDSPLRSKRFAKPAHRRS